MCLHGRQMAHEARSQHAGRGGRLRGGGCWSVPARRRGRGVGSLWCLWARSSDTQRERIGFSTQERAGRTTQTRRVVRPAAVCLIMLMMRAASPQSLISCRPAPANYHDIPHTAPSDTSSTAAAPLLELAANIAAR